MPLVGNPPDTHHTLAGWPGAQITIAAFAPSRQPAARARARGARLGPPPPKFLLASARGAAPGPAPGRAPPHASLGISSTLTHTCSCVRRGLKRGREPGGARAHRAPGARPPRSVACVNRVRVTVVRPGLGGRAGGAGECLQLGVLFRLQATKMMAFVAGADDGGAPLCPPCWRGGHHACKFCRETCARWLADGIPGCGRGPQIRVAAQHCRQRRAAGAVTAAVEQLPPWHSTTPWPVQGVAGARPAVSSCIGGDCLICATRQRGNKGAEIIAAKHWAQRGLSGQALLQRTFG
jgi:hypothetical protein